MTLTNVAHSRPSSKTTQLCHSYKSWNAQESPVMNKFCERDITGLVEMSLCIYRKQIWTRVVCRNLQRNSVGTNIHRIQDLQVRSDKENHSSRVCEAPHWHVMFLCNVSCDDDVKGNKCLFSWRTERQCFHLLERRWTMVLKRDVQPVPAGSIRDRNHYNTRLLWHFLAFFFFFFLNSKPTISIWEKQQQQKKNLGTHLSSCVIKQREGANYEWFKYHVPFSWSRPEPAVRPSTPSRARSPRPHSRPQHGPQKLHCWQTLFSLYFSFSSGVRNWPSAALDGRPTLWSPCRRQRISKPRTSELHPFKKKKKKTNHLHLQDS